MLHNVPVSHLPSGPTEPLGYNTVESLLDDVSKQMASSNLARRHSKGSGQRAGGMMRVVKPNSTNNSPRGSKALCRRRTVMGDGSSKRRPTVVEQTFPVEEAYGGIQTSTQTRPVSWHPTTYMPQQLSIPFDHSIPRLEVNNGLGAYGLPPTPAVYSGYASPASTFSPLSQPFLGYDQPYPYTEETSFFPPYSTYQQSTLSQPQMESQDFSQIPIDASMLTQFDWGDLSTNGFNGATAPPTPENFLPIHQLQPNFPAEESIPYHDLEDPDDTGEELVGMGLYDTPEKPAAGEPFLDNYRALMMQQLMGAGYRKAEPTGKGLKLEEAWVPTASDEDEDSPVDEDEDAEGSPAAEELVDTTSQIADVDNNVAAYNNEIATGCSGLFTMPLAVPPELYAGQYYQGGWL